MSLPADTPPAGETPFARAVRLAGGLTALANAIGARPSRVGNWYQRGVPEEFCPAIERHTGVRCEQLLPDVLWTRNEAGEVTGYHVPLKAAA